MSGATWETRKAERKKEFEAKQGLKLVTCTACSGSGHYDNDGSPPCGCCNGTGKMRETRPTHA